MCEKKYAEIDLKKVPSKAMKTYCKAFLNEKVKYSEMTPAEEITGNRFPNDEDRIKTRNNIKKIIKNGSILDIKGSQLDPHEIICKLMTSKSKLEIELLRAQWQVKKLSIIAQLDEDKDRKKGKGIGKCIPMIDVSGSMFGNDGKKSKVQPVYVALALGIMTSELASKPFNDLAISFTETPRMFNFYQEHPDDKCNIIMRDEVGLSTKFDLAIDLILDLCVKNQITSEDIPNLLVFTDGQFNEMNNPPNYSYNYFNKYSNSNSNSNEQNNWKVSHDLLLKKWVDAGYDRVPNIIYWNLRANTPGVQTSADHPGVQMLQGYSSSLLKFVLFGEEFEDTEIDNGLVKVKTSKVTPYDTFRKVIDQECYDKVKDILARSYEKLYSDQIPPLSPSCSPISFADNDNEYDNDIYDSQEEFI
jgi:hypothetical protein